MSELFLEVVNRSISASWLILAVLVIRLLFRKGPKWTHVLLWGIVAIRLLCPVTIESALSLIPSAQTIPEAALTTMDFDVRTGITPVDHQVNAFIEERNLQDTAAAASGGVNLVDVLTVVWLCGVVLLAAHTVFSYWRLRRRVDMAVLLRENIYQSENVTSPFVLGILRPRIYIPFRMEEQHLRYVLAHERAHLRRGDHWWMPLGFLLLTVHWFNPLMWLSYTLLCRDIEMACDERVIGPLSRDQRVDYSRALLTCSVDRRMITACPLAFGEVRVKERIKSVLHYKKPAVGMIAAAMVVCAVLAVCFLTSPAGVPDDADLPEGTKRVSELAFDQLDGSQPAGVGFELVYESENLVIFYGDAGLFGYDLEKGEMVLGIDFVKAYGKEGMVQGEYGTYAEASADGNTILFTYTDPDAPEVSQDAYYIDLPTMTYQTGTFQPLGDVFDRETAVGYVMPGGSISTSKYVRGDETWNVFEGYAA